MMEGVTRYVRALYDVAAELEAMFPGRRFTPDGHMVGSIGEVIAAHIFDLVLAPASQTNWDATRRAAPNETVQIKATGGDGEVSGYLVPPGHPDEPYWYVALRLRRDDRPVEVVYGGDYATVRPHIREPGRNGQGRIRLSRLRQLQGEAVLLPRANEPPVL